MTQFLWPHGVVTALVTPLRDDVVDTTVLDRHIEDQIGAGIAGFVVGGGTGEFGALNLDERRSLAKSVAETVARRVPVIVQTGALATRDAIALSEHASTVGADALLVASPFGEPINWAERVRFYTDVAAAAELPIMVYNTPPSGLLTLEQIRELAGVDGISAVKDSSGDVALLGDLLAWSKTRDFAVYVGVDSLLRDAFRVGAHGVVFGSSNVVPEALVAVANAPFGQTDELWAAVRALLRALEDSSNYVAVCKAFLAQTGLEVGGVRAPYLMPSDDELAGLAPLLDDVKRLA